MDSLTGKKILFLGIGFYDYEDAIRCTLESKGAQVGYVNTCRPDLIFRSFIHLKIKKKAAKRQQRTITRRIIEAPRDNDCVFIIKGQNLTQEHITLLRQRNPKAEFILYLWDSMVRCENISMLLKNIDNVWSFDRVDCQVNPQLKFRPLFYRVLPKRLPKEYDLSFIGWLHSDRLQILRNLKKQVTEQGGTYFLKLYVSPLSYLWLRYIKRTLTPADKDLIIKKPVGYARFQEVTSASRIILDISHPLQSGLTMRTIETLAGGCHLLTTNSDIIHYDQIPKESYSIMDRKNPVLPRISDSAAGSIGQYFSIDQFIHNIFLS